MLRNNNRLWIITEFYYPIITSTGYYTTEIAEYLAFKKLDVNVICTSSKYNETNNFDFKQNEKKNGVEIFRVLINDIDKNNLILRFFRLTWSSLRLFFLILKKVKKGDQMLVLTNPAFIILLMPLVKRFLSVDYTLLVHDVFPENLVAIGKIKSKSISYIFLKNVFDHAYAMASKCIVIGRDMGDIIKSKVKCNSNIVFIPNWSDNDIVFPLNKLNTTIVTSLNLKNKFIFQFAGNMGHAQGIDNILDAIDMVNIGCIHFLFIGGGAKFKSIREHINNSSETHISLIEFQDRSLQNDFLNACDVSIITLNDGMYGLGVPSKTYNILAAGKPIIFVGDENSEIALCIKEYNLGWIVEPKNPKALSELFERIFLDSDNYDIIKMNARQVADTIFSKNVVLEKYYNLFLNLSYES